MKDLSQLSQIVESGCVEWTGYVDRHGYGKVKIEKSTHLAHRVAYAQVIGPIPTGMTVDHLCFNTKCINTEHLRLLTRADNASNQRSSWATHCKSGHEFTPDNTYLRSGASSGRRQCRKCNLSAAHRHRGKVLAA